MMASDILYKAYQTLSLPFSPNPYATAIYNTHQIGLYWMLMAKKAKKQGNKRE